MDKQKRKSKKGRQYNDQNEKSKTMIKKNPLHRKLKIPTKPNNALILCLVYKQQIQIQIQIFLFPIKEIPIL